MLYTEQVRREIYDQLLVTGYLDLDRQLRPHGIDLTLAWVDEPITGAGYAGWLSASGDSSSGAHRVMPFDKHDWLYLEQGVYVCQFNELVHLPPSMAARTYPHEELARCGVQMQTGLLPAGYRGRPHALLLVCHRSGFRVQRNSTLMQVTFEYLPVPASRRYSAETITLGVG